MSHSPPSPVAVANTTTVTTTSLIIGGMLLAIFLVAFGWFIWRTPAKASSSLTTVGTSTQPSLLADWANLEPEPIPSPIPVIPDPVASTVDTKQLRQHAPTTLFVVPDQSAPTTPLEKMTPENPRVLHDTGAYATFANQSHVTTTVSATRIQHPHFVVAAGEVIPAVLETAIQSDLPGRLRAVVTRPVYGYVGSRELIPAGTRLIGQYVNALTQGQMRVFVIWDRLILPDGIAVQIQSPGIDRLGRAGMRADQVQVHFLKRFGESLLLSIIGAGVATVGVKEDDRLNSQAYYRIALAESLQQSAQQSLQQYAAQLPTLSIHQGKAIQVFVAHDLDFHPVLAES